jgi:uncharacterized NAD-dependent epimerase/dehydratase family protein
MPPSDPDHDPDPDSTSDPDPDSAPNLDPDRVAVLAHGKFPDRAKTAVGILRYADYEVVAVLDRERAGSRVAEHVPAAPDVPIVASMADAPDCDALIVGIAPIGGGFDESWRPDVREALERGCDVVAGLHYFLGEDEEFARLADRQDCTLWDVRRPPGDLTVAAGTADEADAGVVLTVGTDCSTGKMTTTMELARAARERGIDAAVVPTGQTGIMIEGWGVAVDRVVSDFAAGAVERMILSGADRELLIVEGQGSVVHPAYSGVTTSILHGAMPDALVLCHTAGREAIHGYEDTTLPDPETHVDLYESLAAPVRGTEVVAGSLATHGIVEEGSAREAVDVFGSAIGAPATDPVRFGPDALLDAVLESIDP